MVDWSARHAKWLMFAALLTIWLTVLNVFVNSPGEALLIAFPLTLLMPFVLVLASRWAERRGDQYLRRRGGDSQ